MVYHEEEADPKVDDPRIDPEHLIKDLKHSRELLAVAEQDQKLFKEDTQAIRAAFLKEMTALEERKEQAQLAIQASRDMDNSFIQDIFVRYGRTGSEALAFHRASTQHMKEVLRKRILLRYRRLDLTKYRGILIKTEQIRNDDDRERLEKTLEDKRSAGDIMFRTNIPNSYLKRVARESRQLIQGINSTLTYVDLLRDIAGKFTRIQDYLDDDSVKFRLTIQDIEERIKSQRQEMVYLASVFHQAARSAERARKRFHDTSSGKAQTGAIKESMLRDVQKALDEHKTNCNNCVQQLVTMNERIKNTADSCFDYCKETIRKFLGILAAKGQAEDKMATALFDRPVETEVMRTYKIMQDLTKAKTPQELVNKFHEQTEQAQTLEATVNRLEGLLETVLRPEQAMFEDEHELNIEQITNRRVALERSFKELADKFDDKIQMTRIVVTEQKDTVAEFKNFIEVLEAINIRIAKVFDTETADRKHLKDHPGVKGLLDLTEKNVALVADKVSKYFGERWKELECLINDGDFLDYRAQKLPSANNRVTYDSVYGHEHGVRQLDHLNAKFITNAQFKEANEQILERARLMEVARLKAANQEADQDSPSDQPDEKSEKKKR